MTTFTIISALMILIALALLAPALLRKRELAASDRDKQNVIIARERLQEMEADLQADRISQEEFAQAKVELEQALLLDLKEEDAPGKVTAGSGKLTLGVIAVLIPLGAVFMYMSLGAPDMLEFDAAKQAANSHVEQGKAPSIEEMLVKLQQHLKEHPDDPQGWYMLARTYMSMQEFPKAVVAYEALLKIVGDEPAVMLALAEAVAMSRQGDMQGRPAELIQKSLAKEPDNQTALWMGGLLESQQGNYAKALEYWRRLESMLADDPGAQQNIQQFIAELEKKLAGKSDLNRK
jgi:cytochrome c-type biogenesis protein CcmH